MRRFGRWRGRCCRGEVPASICACAPGRTEDEKKLWTLARTGQETLLRGDDKVKSYLLLATNCDGGRCTTAHFMSVRVVCNTLQMAIGDFHHHATLTSATTCAGLHSNSAILHGASNRPQASACPCRGRENSLLRSVVKTSSTKIGPSSKSRQASMPAPVRNGDSRVLPHIPRQKTRGHCQHQGGPWPFL